jgi:hypothetical protein
MKSLILAMSLIGVFASTGARADYSNDYADVTGMNVTETIYQHGIGAFVDYHFFQVSTTSLGTGVVSDIQVDVPGIGTFLNIDDLTVEFGTDTGMIGAFDGDMVTEVVGSGDNVLGQKILTAGSYFFKITGNTTGWGLNIDGNNANGAETGAYFFNASAAPVPEPETWAMLVAGLGLVGLQLRRRTNAGKIAIN